MIKFNPKNMKILMICEAAPQNNIDFFTYAKRQIGKRAIPAGSTYKIRRSKFYFKNIRVFPSYLQVGKNFLIEKSKRKMIAEDLKDVLRIAKSN